MELVINQKIDSQVQAIHLFGSHQLLENKIVHRVSLCNISQAKNLKSLSVLNLVA